LDEARAVPDPSGLVAEYNSRMVITLGIASAWLLGALLVAVLVGMAFRAAGLASDDPAAEPVPSLSAVPQSPDAGDVAA
jgi:hypothetical protein